MQKDYKPKSQSSQKSVNQARPEPIKDFLILIAFLALIVTFSAYKSSPLNWTKSELTAAHQQSKSDLISLNKQYKQAQAIANK